VSTRNPHTGSRHVATTAHFFEQLIFALIIPMRRSNSRTFSLLLHCKKSFAKFRCGQRWREPNDVGIGKFLLPRRLVLRHRCQHRNLAHSDMAFFTVYGVLLLQDPAKFAASPGGPIEPFC
jgi:hypothetical protein